MASTGPIHCPWNPPPPLKATFDGDPECLALFLSQVISHLNHYGHLYLSQWVMVVAVMAVLEGEAAKWVATLYNLHAYELVDIGLFLEAL